MAKVRAMSLDRATPPDPYTQLPATPVFRLASTAFEDHATLPSAQAFAADNLSPELSWDGAPEGTAAYVVSCYDPDAPTPSGFWHWFVAGLPASTTSLPTGAGSAGGDALPSGSVVLRNDFGSAEYGGAAPPPGDRPHRYIYAVHALDTADVGIDADTSPAKASFLMLEHIVGRATLTGTYAEPAS